MEVEKVDLQSVQPETQQTFQGKKSVQSDIRESNDEEKRNAAKLMKGAAALAVLAAAGIIGHKTGAFKKLGKMISGEASQLSKNTKNAVDETAEVAANAGKKAEETVTEAVNSTNKAAEEVKPAVTETVEQTTVKPVQDNVEKAANKTEKTSVQTVEKAADASKKVEETAAKPVQDNAEKVVNKSEKAAESATEKAAETLNTPKSLDELAEEALKAGKKTFEKESTSKDGCKILEEFDTNTKKLLKKVVYGEDGSFVCNHYEYDPKTGNQIRELLSHDNGHHVAIIGYRDTKTGNIFDTQYGNARPAEPWSAAVQIFDKLFPRIQQTAPQPVQRGGFFFVHSPR